MIYWAIWLRIYSLKCLKTVWSGLFIHQHCSRLVCTAWVGMESCSRILIVAVYFKDQNWIAKTHYCINCSVVCKIVFCSKFPDIWDNAGRKTRRRRTQAIAKRFTQTQKTYFATAKYVFFTSFAIIYEHDHVVTLSSNFL